MVQYGETLKLDSNGDLSFTSKSIDMINDTDKVQQDLRILLQTVVGENILHRTMGLWIIEGDEITENNANKRVKNTLAQYHYRIVVNKIVSAFDRLNRRITTEAQVTLEGGETIEVRI